MKKLQLMGVELSSLENSPLVSIVIDNYNYARFLRQAIDSVLEQTYRNFEIIVVDDGSTDSSREVMKSYGDRIITVFQNNSGQGAAFNSGVTHSKGQIICLLDADDYFHQDKLKKVVETFQKQPRWVQVSHKCIAVNEEGQPINFGGSVRNFDQGDVRSLLLSLGKYKWMRTSGRAYRREALESTLPIVSGKVDSADAYLLVTVPFYGEVGGIDDALMFYRIHGKNKHARTADIHHLVRGRELIADYINQVVTKLEMTDSFNLQQDADYLTFKAMQAGGVSWIEALKILGLTLREATSLKRSIRETLTRLLWGSICILAPSEGEAVLRFGLNSYLRAKLLGKELKNEPKLTAEQTDSQAGKS